MLCSILRGQKLIVVSLHVTDKKTCSKMKLHLTVSNWSGLTKAEEAKGTLRLLKANQVLHSTIVAGILRAISKYHTLGPTAKCLCHDTSIGTFYSI